MMLENKSILDSEFLHRLEKLSIVNKSLKKGLYSGKRRSKNQGSSIEFADYRTYSPGDDYRQIDWNAYARHEKLFLKTFLDEQELHISIYLDCSKSMKFGTPSKFFKGIQVAAALGYLSLFNFDRVSVYGFDNSILSHLPLLMGKNKVYQLFDFLNNLETGNEGSINESLSSGKATYGRPGISIIISDYLFADGYEKGINFIQAANQEIILIHLLSEDEQMPNLEGDIRLVDSERNSKVELTVTPRILSEYQEALKDFKIGISNYAFKRGMSYLQVNSEMEIEQIIFNIFKKSGLLR